MMSESREHESAHVAGFRPVDRSKEAYDRLHQEAPSDRDGHVVTAPILRAIPEAGPSFDDPSEDLLFMLLEDIEAGEHSFLIVERTTDPSGHTYAQVLRDKDGSYVVEHREGDADHHYGTVVADMRAAHQMLTGWAFQLPSWDDQASWSKIRR